MNSTIRPGFIALHGNQIEGVVETFFAWIKTHPLGPLEEELILTPTLALAEWVKLTLARSAGVCAAVKVNLPGKVIWDLYRTILNEPSISTYSATDKDILVWRLMRILPSEINRASYILIKEYVSRFGDDVLYKLATQVAELFDQYQVYRADWLKSWEEGANVLIDPSGVRSPLRAEEIWQSECWRRIVKDLNEQEQMGIRPHLHAKAMEILAKGEFDVEKLPKRITLLGVNSLPMQNLALLAALSQYTQVFIGVNSPCRFHWADIMEGREYFKWERRRFKSRSEKDLTQVDFSEMHLHANPILSAWGRQSRDFVRQMDEFDDIQKTKESFQHLKLDVFTPEVAPLSASELGADQAPVLLRLIQDQIRDLEPIDPKALEQKDQLLEKTRECQHGANWVANLADASVVFQKTHGLTRELEVLHDQLLGLFDAQSGRQRVEPYDVLVMLPDLEVASPVIQAVFGQYSVADERHIPFSIAEQNLLEHHPLVESFKWLMGVGNSRCQLGDLLTVLKTTCISQCFGLEENDFDQLEHWLFESGMRWGLSGEHREQLGFVDSKELNTILFGIRRMLLGYTNAGQDEVLSTANDPSIWPMASVSGMDAEIVGRFVSFVEVVAAWWSKSHIAQSPKMWGLDLSELMSNLIRATSLSDIKVMQAMSGALSEFLEHAQEANFEEPISLKVAASAWMDGLKVGDKRQRVLSNGVTFGSIKTMHSIPSKVICLVGMNEGDFPRVGVHNPFDLMEKKGQSRVGDRSKSQDDRALMLQALLSAREKLYVSWSALSERDNSFKSPSVLVSQLRQYIADKWSASLLDQLTSMHPMQPFGVAYFKEGTPLKTYAKEWFSLHTKSNSKTDAEIELTAKTAKAANQERHDDVASCDIQQIVQTFKNPVRQYFKHALSVNFYPLEQERYDEESFGLDALQVFQLKDQLLKYFELSHYEAHDIEPMVRRYLSRLQLSGHLPLGPMGELLQEHLLTELEPQLGQALQLQQTHPLRMPDMALKVEWGPCELIDSVSNLRAMTSLAGEQSKVYIELVANRLMVKKDMRPHQLLKPWIMSVLFAHLELDIELIFLFADVKLKVVQPEKELADRSWEVLSAAYEKTQMDFLAMPLKTALVYAKGKDTSKAKGVYEGSDHVMGEVSDMSLERIFPTFEALTRDAETVESWGKTFEPFWEWFDAQLKPVPYAKSISAPVK